MSIFDTPTYPFHTEPGRDLARLLADIYWRQDDTLSVLRQAGVPLRAFRINSSSEHLWQEILDLSARRARIKSLIDVILDDENVEAYWPRIRELVSDEPAVSFDEDVRLNVSTDSLSSLTPERQTG